MWENRVPRKWTLDRTKRVPTRPILGTVSSLRSRTTNHVACGTNAAAVCVKEQHGRAWNRHVLSLLWLLLLWIDSYLTGCRRCCGSGTNATIRVPWLAVGLRIDLHWPVRLVPRPSFAIVRLDCDRRVDWVRHRTQRRPRRKPTSVAVRLPPFHFEFVATMPRHGRHPTKIACVRVHVVWRNNSHAWGFPRVPFRQIAIPWHRPLDTIWLGNAIQRRPRFAHSIDNAP